mgnify:CR=1 FL=1
MEIVWSDLAFESFSDILQYIQGFFGKKTADSIAAKMISFVESLGHSPRMGRELLHLSRYGEERCAFYKQNHIYYQVFENRIEVIIIWDGRQDPRHLQNLLIDFLTK